MPAEVAEGLDGLTIHSEPLEGFCKICGQFSPLNREHVPPASSGNKGTSFGHSLEDWLNRSEDGEMAGGRHQQGGVWMRTLCERCNRRTGDYATEYRGWVARAARIIVDLPDRLRDLDNEPVSRGVTVRFSEVRPGRFGRQVVSMVASLSAGWDLIGRNPQLRGVLLDGEVGELPEEMFLGMTLYAGPHARYAGPFVYVDQESESWSWSIVMAHPPFAFELSLLSSSNYVTQLCGIGDFLKVGTGTKSDVDLDLFIAFGHTALPTDWRTACQIEDGLNLDGSPARQL